MPTTLRVGQTNVTTAGTRVQLSNLALLSGVTIKAKSTNTGVIYLGDSGVTSSNGHRLLASESVFIEIDNVNRLYIDSSVNGEGISYIGT
jgi:hypothetical protein